MNFGFILTVHALVAVLRLLSMELWTTSAILAYLFLLSLWLALSFSLFLPSITLLPVIISKDANFLITSSMTLKPHSLVLNYSHSSVKFHHATFQLSTIHKMPLICVSKHKVSLRSLSNG